MTGRRGIFWGMVVALCAAELALLAWASLPHVPLPDAVWTKTLDDGEVVVSDCMGGEPIAGNWFVGPVHVMRAPTVVETCLARFGVAAPERTYWRDERNADFDIVLARWHRYVEPEALCDERRRALDRMRRELAAMTTARRR